jgi:hypothetical protein
MARTALTVTQLKQDNYAVQAGDLAIPFASDAVNGNKFVASGQEIIIAQNTDASAHTFTVASVADHLGRTQDITAYSVPANSSVAIQMSALEGWKQSDGNVYLNSSDATLKFAVVRKS